VSRSSIEWSSTRWAVDTRRSVPTPRATSPAASSSHKNRSSCAINFM
jgi:hypothetical protein